MEVVSLRARPLGLALLLLVAMMSIAATGNANAATIKQITQTSGDGDAITGVGLYYRAAPGERNKISTACTLLAAGSTPLKNWYQCSLTETGAPIFDDDGAGGCSVSGNVGTCYVYQAGIDIGLADGADNAAGPFGAATPATKVSDGPGNDVIWLNSERSNVTMDAGGADTVIARVASYGSRPIGVTVTLDGKANDGSSADGPADQRDNVMTRDVNGTGYNDVLIGDGQANALGGNGGNDQLIGCGGDDYSYGDDGSDKMLDDRPGTCLGGGRDHQNGGPGADVFDTGAEMDWVEAKDYERDRKISCGGGDDYIWADAIDPASKGCEHHQS